MDLQSLQVATPERVAVGLPVAGVGYRCLAYLVDVCLIFVFWVTAYFVYSFLESDLLGRVQGLSGFGWTLLILGAFSTQWLYWTVCEVLSNGQTPGKRALRIRVVRADGGPVGFFESAVRNVCRVVDFLPGLYGFGLLMMLVTRHHLRLGDLLAGTVLIRDERPSLERYRASSLGDIKSAGLETAHIELVLELLARAPELEPAVRVRLAGALIEKLSPHLSVETVSRARADPESAPAILEALARARPSTESNS